LKFAVPEAVDMACFDLYQCNRVPYAIVNMK